MLPNANEMIEWFNNEPSNKNYKHLLNKNLIEPEPQKPRVLYVGIYCSSIAKKLGGKKLGQILLYVWDLTVGKFSYSNISSKNL